MSCEELVSIWSCSRIWFMIRLFVEEIGLGSFAGHN